MSLKTGRRDANYLDRVLTGLIGVRNRETTALLAVVGELLVDDPGQSFDADARWRNATSICRDGSPLYRGSTSTVRYAEPTYSVTLTNS